MTRSVYTQSFSQDQFPLCRSDVPLISGVAGHITRVVGKVVLPISIQEQHFEHPFYILESMNHDIILGVDFLREHKAKISFEDNHVMFPDSRAIPLVSKEAKKVTVKAIFNVSLPARTQTVLPVQCSNVKTQYGIIEPVPSLHSDEQLVGAKCVVKTVQGKSVFHIMNPTDNTVEIKRNQVVGLWEPLSDDMCIESFEVDGKKTTKIGPTQGDVAHNTVTVTESTDPSEFLSRLGITMED